MRAMPTPSANDGPGFHSNMPISELTECDTQAIKASVVSSAPLVAETTNGVTHKTRPTPTKPNGLGGLRHPTPTRESDRLRFKGWPAKGLRPPHVKQS